MSRFAGKVIIVTGSSSGIGQAAALAFAKEGAYVTIHGTNSERIQTTCNLLTNAGIDSKNYIIVQGEIEKEETVQKLISETVKNFGKIDILVNNAGISHEPGVDSISIENFDKVMAVNVRALVDLFLYSSNFITRVFITFDFFQAL